jgi:hypothetical protein
LPEFSPGEKFTDIFTSLQSGLFSPPQDDLAHIDRLLSIANKLGSLRGGGGGEPSGWDTGLQYIRELMPLALPIAGALGLRIPGLGAPATPGAPAVPPMPAFFDPYADHAALKTYAQSLNGHAAAQAAAAPGSAPSTAAPPTAAGGAAPPNDLLTLFQQYGMLLVNALNSGTSGADFADALCCLTGTATHAMIAAHGEDAIVSTMLTVPALAIFGEPRLRSFAREFLDFETILEQMARESESAKPAAAAN